MPSKQISITFRDLWLLLLECIAIYLQQYNLLSELQSACRRCHSSETSMLSAVKSPSLQQKPVKLHLLVCWILLLHLTQSTMPSSSRDMDDVMDERSTWVTAVKKCHDSVLWYSMDSTLELFLFLLYVADVIELVMHRSLIAHAFTHDLQICSADILCRQHLSSCWPVCQCARNGWKMTDDR